MLILFKISSLIGTIVLCWTVFLAVHISESNPAPWNHPGEPPLFDMLLYVGATCSFMTVPLWRFAKHWQEDTSRRAWGWFPPTTALLCLAAMTTGLLGILERHGDRWSEVRNGMQNYVDSVANVTGISQGGVTDAEYETIRRSYVPEKIQVDLPGYGAVWLMNWGIDDSEIFTYIGGSMARFDRWSMICTSSD